MVNTGMRMGKEKKQLKMLDEAATEAKPTKWGEGVGGGAPPATIGASAI